MFSVFFYSKNENVFSWNEMILQFVFFAIFLNSSSLYRTSLRHKRTIRAKKNWTIQKRFGVDFIHLKVVTLLQKEADTFCILIDDDDDDSNVVYVLHYHQPLPTVCKTKRIALNQQPRTPFENLILVRREMAFEEKLSEGKRNDVSHMH